MLFTNIIITSLLYITKGYTYLSFTIIFFVKYSITSLLISSLLILLKLNIKKIRKIIKKRNKKINLKKLILFLLITTLLVTIVGSIKKYTSNIVLYRKENTIKIKSDKDLIEFDFDTLGKDLPTSKSSDPVNVDVIIKTGSDKLKTYGIISVQGTSTQYWPKKNWSLKLFKDKERTKEVYLEIGDSIASNKWVLKADWIDPLMYRNGVSYMLWDQITKSRDTNFLEVKQSNLINENAKGSPFYFTSTLNVNNEHYGIVTLLMAHDINNFNINKDNEHHVYFEFDARGGDYKVKTYTKFSKEGIGKWIDSYYPKDNDFTLKQINKIDEFGKFLNSSLKEAKLNYDKYLDKENMIDMLLYIEFIYDWDGLAQDLEVVSYNLDKYYFLPWDKDTTFGINYNETGLIEGSETRLLINYDKENETQKPWYKTYHVYKDEVEKRYKDLRDKEVFSASNIETLMHLIDSKLTDELREKESNRWPNRPSVKELTKVQMLNWSQNRLEVLDKHFNYESAL